MTESMCDIERARTVAASVVDPELPMLTLAELGVLRFVVQESDGTIIVAITPTYSGCPAMGAMRADLHRALVSAGIGNIEIRTVLAPPWSSDWISPSGRRKLREHGIAPPGPAPSDCLGPVPLTLVHSRPAAACPRCASTDTEQISEFGATACAALFRCRCCGESFDRIREI